MEILFNHESPTRGETFVTRKITIGVSKISLGLQKTIYLGNLNAKRDWGHAKDYVEAMWLMLQNKKPKDYVITSGITTSIKEFLLIAFKEIGIDIEFKHDKEKEIGIVTNNNSSKYIDEGQIVIKIDPKYYRPTEVDLLVGDPSRAMKDLSWKPKYNLKTMIREMIKSDIKIFKKINF